MAVEKARCEIAMAATNSRIETSLINLQMEEKLLSIGSSGDPGGAAHPSLLASVGKPFAGNPQAGMGGAPRGFFVAAINTSLTQDHIINLENEPARRGAARKQDSRQVAPVHPAKFRDTKREALPFSSRHEILDRRLESEAFGEQHEAAGLAVSPGPE